MDKHEELEKIKRAWSSKDADFYKELEAFIEKHKDAHSIVFDTDSGCPRHAIYAFTPFQCYIEGEILKVKIAQAMLEVSEND